MLESGHKIGNIRLTSPLGRGGMGDVWAGFDEKLKREVAVKAIRGDTLDAASRARFLYEARVLSQLEHPNIPRLFERIEDHDNDYLILELVRGRTLRRALEDDIAPEERLEIAEQIAVTLADAHGKGVVHRDLKPENIMLAEGDGVRVKVLDFGLARFARVPLTKQPLTKQPLTKQPLTIGADSSTTAEFSPTMGSDVEPFSDVTFSPTDHSPTDHSPTIPGTVVGTLVGMSPEQARGESVTAASDMYSFGLLLHELITGETPYEPGLCRDRLLIRVERGETRPIVEGDVDLVRLIERLESAVAQVRPSAMETVRELRWIRGKPARRRRVAFAALVLLTFALGGLKYTLDLTRERDEAEVARRDAEGATEFLVGLFLDTNAWSEGNMLSARDLLDRAADRLVEAEEAEPRFRARLLHTVGDIYQYRLGLLAPADQLLQRAVELRRELGEKEPLVRSLEVLGWTRLRAKHYVEAEEAFNQALQHLGPESTAKERGSIKSGLASVALRLGKLDRAMELFQESLERLEHHDSARPHQLASAHGNMGRVLLSRGRKAEAVVYLEQSVAFMRQVPLAESGVDLAITLDNLALCKYQLGALDEARALLEESVELMDAHTPEHPKLVNTWAILMDVYAMGGYLSEIEKLLPRVTRHAENTLAANDAKWIGPLYYRGTSAARRGELAEAEATLRKILKLLEGTLGEDDVQLAEIVRALADVVHDSGDLEAAWHLYERARRIWESARGENFVHLAAVHEGLARWYQSRGETESALFSLRRSMTILETNAAVAWDYARVLPTLTDAHLELGDLAAAEGAAERYLKVAQRMLKDAPGSPRAQLSQARAWLRLGKVRVAKGDHGGGRELWRRALDTVELLAIGTRDVGRHRLLEELRSLLAA